jgi:hypothetical protein
VTWLLLALAPFVDAFWQRDLGALARELAEDRAPGEEHLLFADLLRLATCEPLQAVSAPSPLRILVRAEEARRGRLGAAAAASATLWRDLLQKDFFRRTAWNPSFAAALRWPAEREVWPDETELVPDPPFRCADAKPRAAELPLHSPALIASLPPEAAARAQYQRTVLLHAEAEKLDVERLPAELRPAGPFLRLEAGLAPRALWIPLAAKWPAKAIVLRAAQQLAEQREEQKLLDLTASVQGEDPMARHILWLRALALLSLGREEEMLDALLRAFAMKGAAQGLEPMRDLALAALAGRPFDLFRLRAVVGKDENAALSRLGHRALARGNLRAARAVAERLAGDTDLRWHAQGIELAGEIGWTASEPAVVEDAFAQLFPAEKKPFLHNRDRHDRDLAFLALGHALVTGQAQRRDASWQKRLEVRLASMRDAVLPRNGPQLDGLLRALADLRGAPAPRGEQAVALGEVPMQLAPQPPPAPAISLELPEPRSLLAIPAPDGSLRDWFDSGGAP